MEANLKEVCAHESRLGLESMTILLEYLGNPQKDLTFIHVAGTNGKGSFIAFLSSILIQAGYKTGVYTSPALVDDRETICINKNMISEKEMQELSSVVADALIQIKKDGKLVATEFEAMSALAILYFKKEGCDYCILEVGLGGALDATNVIDCPKLAVITSISMDHMGFLGNTIEEIATQKAGIIKENGLVLTMDQQVVPVIQRIADDKNAKLVVCKQKPYDIAYSLEGITFSFDNLKQVSIHLLGTYQVQNACLAIYASRLLKIDDLYIRKGLESTSWPGRFEILRKDPIVLIDGSHNLDGVKTLSDSLSAYFGDKKIYFVLGVLADKEYETMADLYLKHAKEIYTITVPNPRALSADEYKKVFSAKSTVPVYACDSIEQAVNSVMAKADGDDVIAICGSLYYIGTVRRMFLY